MRAYILCGGLGTRLRPYTNHVPKPLVSLGGKPILEWIIKCLRENDVSQVVLIINHLGYMIQSYFGNGSRFGVSIEYIVEESRLGTAGALGLVEVTPSEPVIVMNGDVISDLNYGALVDWHVGNQCDATVVAYEKDYQVPLGILRVGSNHCLADYEEKPTLHKLISCGIYVFNSQLFGQISAEPLDMPDLLKKLMITNKVGVFKHDGLWMDLGNQDDLEKAEQLYHDSRINL